MQQENTPGTEIPAGAAGEFVNRIDLSGVSISGVGCAGGLRDLHGDVWCIPHSCAAGGRWKFSASRDGLS